MTKLMLFLLCLMVSGLEGSKIFFMIPLTTVSEKNLYVPLINELARRGHDVTVASIKKSTYESKNVKEFCPLSYEEFMGGEDTSDPRVSREQGKLMMFTFEPEFNYVGCHKVFQNEQFMEAALGGTYDLIFTNYFFQHCFAGILHRQGTPFIMVSTMPPIPFVFELTGYKLPMSIVPNSLFTTTDAMTFFERVLNTIFDIYWTNYEKYSYIPQSEKIYRQYLGQELPGGFEIESNVSLIFSNSHPTLNAPTPVLPDIVEIGGIHCRPPKPLPKDIEDFVSGATEGFIFFSMGTVVQGKNMPKEWVDIFVSVFSKLKQKVLWKWEDEEVAKKFPKNIMARAWLPQQDILGHPNIRLFITHGGAFSTQESLYHGVPMIGFPIFGDQDLNMMNSERKGFAKMLEILDLSEQMFGDAVNDMLNDPRYTTKAKKLSAIFRDQRETPLERAVYFTEYTIRHNGTAHLRSVGRDIPMYQYYLWDVFAFIGAIILASLLLPFLVLRCIFRLLCGKKNVSENERDKKRN